VLTAKRSLDLMQSGLSEIANLPAGAFTLDIYPHNPHLCACRRCAPWHPAGIARISKYLSCSLEDWPGVKEGGRSPSDARHRGQDDRVQT
jgi:hypothetical protein